MVERHDIPYEIEFDDDTVENPKYLLVLDETKPVATCRIEHVDATTAKIERVIVLSEYQGKGVGRYMITETEKRLRTEGYNRIIISSRDITTTSY